MVDNYARRLSRLTSEDMRMTYVLRNIPQLLTIADYSMCGAYNNNQHAP